ncbi:MAG: hypothetical protein CMI16_07095 [Opitutaceae bacterium]|nr:hypothetical protein [Opitutaceae bacterium]
MFRLCFVKVFRPPSAPDHESGGRPGTDSRHCKCRSEPQFVRYAHSCADHECRSPCDGVVVVLDAAATADKRQGSLVPWSHPGSEVRTTTESWWWQQDTLTRFVLSEHARVSLDPRGNLLDAKDASCTDTTGRRLLPKYEPRVPVQEARCDPCVQHVVLTLAADDAKTPLPPPPQSPAQGGMEQQQQQQQQLLHLFVCHSSSVADEAATDGEAGESTMSRCCAASGVDCARERVVFVQFVHGFVDTRATETPESGCALFAGELPGTTADSAPTGSKEVWLLCRWANLKHVMWNVLSPEKGRDMCKYSCALHVTA